MHNGVYLPVLHHFENGNVFTGSCGALRYKITPNVVMANQKEVDLAASAIRAEYWHGLLCYELSDIESERTFPMSEQGMEQMRGWLQDHVNDSKQGSGGTV